MLDHKWRTLVVRYMISEHAISVFVDGEPVAHCEGRLPLGGMPTDVTLGRAGEDAWNGDLRDVRIYASLELADQTIGALSQSEQLLSAWQWRDWCWSRTENEACVADVDAQLGLMNREAAEASLADAYVYDPELTPYVRSINRRNGTTAGGTTIELDGEGFGDDMSVELDGVKCAVEYEDIGSYRDQHLCVWGDIQRAKGLDIAVDCSGLGGNDTHVTCLSNPVPNNIMMNPVAGAVDVINPLHGRSKSPEDVTYSYANLWSKKTTWGGYNPPRLRESGKIAELPPAQSLSLTADRWPPAPAVVVTMNEFIILDLSPPELNLIILQGTLKFSDLSDIHLKAHYILIHKGRLMVGTQNTPFMHEAVITMLGTRADLEIPVYGAK